MFTVIKVYACYALKFTKTTPTKISKRGAHAWCAGPGSAFAVKHTRHCYSILACKYHELQYRFFIEDIHPELWIYTCKCCSTCYNWACSTCKKSKPIFWHNEKRFTLLSCKMFPQNQLPTWIRPPPPPVKKKLPVYKKSSYTDS